MRRQLGVYSLALSFMLLFITKVPAGGPTFTPIDFPGGFFTIAADVNKTGLIVGRYTDTAGIVHGFLLSSGTFTSVTFPGALWTRAIGINSSGDIVGDYSLTSNSGVKDVHGFRLRGGIFLSLDSPGAPSTVAQGIDTNGDVVGFYMDTGGSLNDRHGFLLSRGAFTSIDFPGAASTEAWRINDLGEILGRYKSSSDNKWHLYRLYSGSFTSVADFPGAAQTAPGRYSHVGGFNSRGDIVSSYCSPTPCQEDIFNPTVIANLHGFLRGGVYTSIDFPAALATASFGINDGDDIVGAYEDASGAIHGYLRTP